MYLNNSHHLILPVTEFDEISYSCFVQIFVEIFISYIQLGTNDLKVCP